MFELNYAITANDLKAVNKKIFSVYFCLYFGVALFGIAVGIAAIVLSPSTSILVLGIVILVFAAILLAVSLLMAIAPKNFVTSVVPTSDQQLSGVIDKHGVTVGDQNVLSFADMQKIKKYKDFFTVGTAASVFIVKNAITSGQSYDELYSYMSQSIGKLLLEPTAQGDGKAEPETTEPAMQDGVNADEQSTD